MATTVKKDPVQTRAPKMTPATVAELVPGNIERATRIDKDYVIVKLRDTNAQKSPNPHSVNSDAGGAFLPMSADHLGQLRTRLAEVLPGADVENSAYLDQLAAQEKERRAQMVHKGQLIEAKELASRLGITVQAISQALKARRLFDLDCGGGKRLYPAFYADPESDRATLGEITRLLGDIPASAKWQFFSTPKQSLNGRTPLQALKDGDVAKVQTSVRGFLER